MSQETIFEKVRFRNFQSFGQIWTEIQLNLRGTTLIIGENLDEGGSSGAGKTTAMSVVSYCLYDKIPSGISKDRMVNSTNGKKNTSMEAELYFSKNGNRYLIKRSRGQVTGVQLFENDKDITPASVVEVNAKVEDLIGFSYNLFSHIVLFRGNSRPFLDLSVGDQRALIEELFKITLLTKKANALKKQESETSKLIDLTKLLIQQQELQNEGYHKRCRESVDRVEKWEDQRSRSINVLEDQLKLIRNFDFDAEETFHNEIVRLSQEISFVKSEVTILTAELNNKLRERPDGHAELTILEREYVLKSREVPSSNVDVIRAEIESAEKERQRLKGEIDHLKNAKCPYCLQDYVASLQKLDEKISQDVSLSEKIIGLRTKLVEAEAEVEVERARLATEAAQLNEQVIFKRAEIEKSLEKLENEVKVIKAKVDSTSEKHRALVEEQAGISACVFYKTLSEALKAKQSLSTIEKQIEMLQAEVNPHLAAAQDLMQEGEIKIDYEKLDELINLQAHQKFLIKLLTDKNSYVRKNLISSTTPFLNKRIGYYLEKLNLPHVVLFQPDMTCQITQLQRELDHGNLSNGEIKRLNLALCLSFRDVLTYLHSKVNVLFTDEVDGGSLDSNCVDLLITLLKKKAWDDNISIFIISHRPEFEGRCDRSYVVRKEQGFSSLIIQPDS